MILPAVNRPRGMNKRMGWNQGLHASATSSQVAVANQTRLDGRNAYTAAAWVYYESGYAGGRVFAHAPSGAGGGIQIISNSTNDRFECFARGPSPGQFDSDSNVIKTGRLHLVVMTKANATSAPDMFLGYDGGQMFQLGGSDIATSNNATVAADVIEWNNYPGFDLGQTGVYMIGGCYYAEEFGLDDAEQLNAGEIWRPSLLMALRFNSDGSQIDLGPHGFDGTTTDMDLVRVPGMSEYTDPFARPMPAPYSVPAAPSSIVVLRRRREAA